MIFRIEIVQNILNYFEKTNGKKNWIKTYSVPSGFLILL